MGKMCIWDEERVTAGLLDKWKDAKFSRNIPRWRLQRLGSGMDAVP